MFASIVIDVSTSKLERQFDYIVPEDLSLVRGDRVLVPFGNKQVIGFVIEIKETSGYDEGKLKCVIKKLDHALTEDNLGLCFFMQRTFFTRLIDAIKLCLPPIVTSGKVKDSFVDYVLLNTDNLQVKNAKQLEILLYLKEYGKVKKSDLTSKFSESSLKTLIKNGLLKLDRQKVNRAPKNLFTEKKKNIILNEEQQLAVDRILRSKFNVFLLHGVTGSGKTEVYINVIKNVLSQGKTAIMLVPEISLTPQMFARFKNAFGETVAILHSGLTQGERYDEWLRLKRGEAKIALGARSCVFAPVSNVGVIIIDEEHDGSYYSESNPRFHTHEIARYLAYLNSCPLILGSATPSIESFYKVKTGEYSLITLNNRANKKELPNIEIVDMLMEARKGNINMFSYRFLNELEECIKQNSQAMIFINRRGYSSFLMCRECGYVPKCEDCDVSLVYHKEDNMLKCHYCAKRYKVLNKCPKCGSTSIRYGAVGTQRVVEELQKILGNVPIFRLDNDTSTNKQNFVKTLEEFNKTTPAVLVGTQMIAKGHDFNNVTLVGIIDADISLHFSDYRATERTFNLITQVSGRAGRSEKEGKVILQTYYPRHYVYRCASTYDYPAFYKREIAMREVSHFPPFVEMLRVLVVGKLEKKVTEQTESIFFRLKELREQFSSDFVYLQAMKCPKKRLQGNFRYQIMMRIYKKNSGEIIPKIYDICKNITVNNVSVFVELDPQNLS